MATRQSGPGARSSIVGAYDKPRERSTRWRRLTHPTLTSAQPNGIAFTCGRVTPPKNSTIAENAALASAQGSEPSCLSRKPVSCNGTEPFWVDQHGVKRMKMQCL